MNRRELLQFSIERLTKVLHALPNIARSQERMVREGEESLQPARPKCFPRNQKKQTDIKEQRTTRKEDAK